MVGATTQIKTSRVAEVTFGTTPASPVFVEMPVTSNGLKSSPSRQTSATINPDGQPRQTLLMKFDPAGAIKGEIRFSDFDGEIEAVQRGSWSNKLTKICVNADTEISDITSEVVTVDAGGANWKVGMLGLFTGFGDANEGVLARVASSGATSITFGAGLTNNSTIPAGAKIRQVGFQGASGDITATANGLGSTLLDFTTLGLAPGEWVWVGGDGAGNTFATTGVGGWCQLLTIAAHAIAFNVKPSTWATDSGTSKTIEVFCGDFLKNGMTQKSFTLERQQQGISAPVYEYFAGQTVDSISLPFDPEKAIEATFNYMGFKVPTAPTTRAGSATDTAPSTYDSFVTSANCGLISMGGLSLSGPSYLMSWSIEIGANQQKQSAVGYKAGVGFTNGEISAKGSLSAYFGDVALYNASLGGNYTSLTTSVGYVGTTYREGYVFDVPHLKVSLDADVSGKNGSRMVSGSYLADMHPTLGFVVGIGRFWYRPAVAVA